MAHAAPLIVSNLLVVGLAYLTFGDPIVFMQVVLAALTMYFFFALLRTGAQVIHGFTTVAAASGIWFLVAALHNGALGKPLGWASFVAIVAAIGVSAAVLWPVLGGLPTSERVMRTET